MRQGLATGKTARRVLPEVGVNPSDSGRKRKYPWYFLPNRDFSET
jgi:hypothetical protein